MFIGLHIQYPYSCQILLKLEFSPQIFEEYFNIKFHEILPVGFEIFHADRRTDRQSDVTKLIFALRNLANVPKNY
jgi:hypothetical protein